MSASRHDSLHASLDELITLYLVAHPAVVPSQVSLLDFMAWSFRQSCPKEQKLESTRFLA